MFTWRRAKLYCNFLWILEPGLCVETVQRSRARLSRRLVWNCFLCLGSLVGDAKEEDGDPDRFGETLFRVSHLGEVLRFHHHLAGGEHQRSPAVRKRYVLGPTPGLRCPGGLHSLDLELPVVGPRG